MVNRSALLPCLAASACATTSPRPVAPLADDKSMMAGIKQSNEAFTRDCPWPDWQGYAHATEVTDRTRAPLPLPPSLQANWLDGCAIVRFSIDEDGDVTQAEALAAQPAAAGVHAVEIVKQGHYARGDTPDAVFLLRVGFSHSPSGGLSITKMFR